MDNILSERARSNLLVHRAAIAQDLTVDYVIDPLISDFCISVEESELINAEVTRRRKATKLLDIIATKGQRVYNSLHKILGEKHSHLAVLLEDGVTIDGVPLMPGLSPDILSEEEIQIVMTRGGVPPRPAVFITPTDKLKEVRDALYQLQDKIGWVLIHGMGGIGKSVLASEAIRSSKILTKLYPGGVFWVSISNVEKARLLTKLQNLCARLDRESRPPPLNLEEAKDRLRVVLLEQHPRCLLILDDVWSSKVARIFDVQCRVLVTSRDKSIVDTISCPVFSISIEHGFTEMQALETLALWTDKTTDELPPEAHQIYEASKGNPLVISLIGGLLRDHPHRWEYYRKKLREKKYSRLRKVSSYEYESVDEAIGVSVEQLPDESKELYFDFVILEGGVKITAKALSILWDEEMEFVEDEMLKLANKSLVLQEWNEQHRCMSYAIHDLQLDFIKQNCENMKDVHKKLVSRYKKLCHGKYHTLEDDGYIHEHLPMHMAKAHCCGELRSVLLSLDWIVVKLAVMGSSAPANILSDYIKYSHYLPTKEEIDLAKEFQLFVSVNAHLLVQPLTPDVTQLALSQPPDSLVYKQAEQRALKTKSGFYVNWCNRPSIMDSILMRSKIHDGRVCCANFSPEADLIASCGEDENIKIWESTSGQVNFTFDAHSDCVNWCEFSPDGTKLLSCSNDKTIKLFNVVDYKLIATLIGHTGEVYMCVFSHDGQRAASCSEDLTVKIWDLVNLRLERTMIGHTEAVRGCQWSHDDKLVVSCSNDSTVKVFDVKSGGAKSSYDQHESFVTCCCVAPNARLVASGANENLHIWEMNNGEQLGVCVCRAQAILCCAFSPNGNHIATGCSDFSIWLWDISSLKSLAVCRGHSSWVLSVAFDLSGEQLLSASDDETVMVWKVDCLARDDNLILKRDFAARFSADDVTVVTSDLTHACLVIDENGQRIRAASKSSSRVRSVAISSDGKAACGNVLGDIFIISTIYAKELCVLKGHTSAIRYCTFNHNGTWLVSTSEDTDLRLWNLTKPSQYIVLKGHMDSVNMCSFYKNDTRLLSSSHDGTLKVWDVASGNVVLSIAAHDNWIFSSDLSSDEKFAVSVSVDKTAKIWDISTGKLLHTLNGDGGDIIRTCCVAPNSRNLATGNDQGVIKIWDMISGKELATCDGHNSWVTDIKFSQDSQYILTVGDNVKWWRVDGSSVQIFHIRGSFVRLIEADDAFQRFVTIGNTGILYILSLIKEPQKHALHV